MQFKYFNELCKLKSFTKVAEANFVSQSIISKSIKILEEYFKVKLLERTKFSKEIQLTEAGKIVYEFCEKLQEKMNELESDFEKKDIKKCITIGFSEELVSSYFNKYLDILTQKKVKFIIEDMRELKRRIRNGNLDFIFNYYLSNIEIKEDIESILLEKVNLALWTSKKDRLSKEEFIRNLENMVIVSLKKGTLQYEVLNIIMLKLKKEPKRVIYVDSIEMVYKLVQNNIAKTILWERKSHMGGIEQLKLEEMELNICLEYFKHRDFTKEDYEIIDGINMIKTDWSG